MNSRTLGRAAAVAAALSLGAAAHAAPVVWNAGSGGNGNSYEVLVNDTITWDGALAAAQAAGGHLATINSQAEQNFIASVMTSADVPTGSYWFGLRETATEGVYENVTGEAQTFSHWFAGEPNNAGGVEAAAAVLWTANGGDASLIARRGAWNDAPLSGYPIAGVPTPAQADVLRAGYLIERAADDNGNGGGNGNGEPNAVPLPAAALTFPIGAAFAGIFYRRMRRGR